MPELIYNDDIAMVYEKPRRELKNYEHKVSCPKCKDRYIEDFRSLKVFPPFACEHCGEMFTIEELAESVRERQTPCTATGSIP